MIDLLAFPVDEAIEILKKHNKKYLCVETKAPFVYNKYMLTNKMYVVKQHIDEVGLYTLYITKKFVKGGAHDGL